MKKSIVILFLLISGITFAGITKNRPTMPRDPHGYSLERPKRGNAPWPIPH
jgi:hypothetical protein